MVWWKNSYFICLCVCEIFIKKKNSIALQLHVLVLPKPYVDLHDTNLTHMCLVVALSFIKRCDPSEMSFILVWSRSRALHQLNFYTGSQLCHSIHQQSKTPCLMISLSLVSFKCGMGYSKKKKKKEKRWHAQEAWPQKKVRKKWTHQCPWKKKRKKNIYIAMSSCYPNKRERDS